MSLVARFVLLSYCASVVLAQGVITKVAGADWSLQTTTFPNGNAPLSHLRGVAVDGQGDVYFSDQFNNRVFRQSPDGRLSVIAGNGIGAFSGDGGPAISAAIDLSSESFTPAFYEEYTLGGGIAVDGAGNVYLADTLNYRIRKISVDGTITTVAGIRTSGFSGDGGPALSAALNLPSAVALDRAGNLYISDTNNDRIRKVTPNGTITTFAGGGTSLGDGGPATSANLNSPEGLAFDAAGNLYVADYRNARIRKIRPDGTISTVAGTGQTDGFIDDDGKPAASARLQRPTDVAVDSAGNLYIADSYNHAIRQVSVSTNIIRTVAGNSFSGFTGDGGPAVNAKLNLPQGIAVDGPGNLYITDWYNRRLRKVTAADGFINTVAGNGNYRFSGDGGPATSATFNFPNDLAIDKVGNLIIADTENNRIRKVDTTGRISTVAGNGFADFGGDSGPAVNAALFAPQGVAIDSAGNIYVADTGNCVIRQIDLAGAIHTVAGNWLLCGQNLRGVGNTAGDGGPATQAALHLPVHVAVDSQGTLYISDLSASVIRKVRAGVITTLAGTGAVGDSGDGGPATLALLRAPDGIATDSQGNVYFADNGACLVRKVSPGGVITTVAGNRKSCTPSGDGGSALLGGIFPNSVSLDRAGNLVIADYYGVVRQVTPAGIISTVAGNGTADTGDGGLATDATLSDPPAAVPDLDGNLYIIDNQTVRKVLAAPPSVLVSTTNFTFTGQSTGAPAPTQSFSITSVPGLDFTLTAVTSTGANWLKLSPEEGKAARLIDVVADPGNITSPGVYQGTIQISTPNGKPARMAVSVTFNVGAAQPPSLAPIDPSNLTFTFTRSTPLQSQTLKISNAGGGTLNFTVSATVRSPAGGRWLTVSQSSGQATPRSPLELAVIVNPSGLAVGTYSGSVDVSAGGTTLSVPVVLAISATDSAILLSQRGLSFTAVSSGGIVPPQTFSVLNIGSQTVNFTVTSSTLSGGGWLSVNPGSGSVSAGSVGSSTITVNVLPSGLAPGVYYGKVQVDAPGAANTPQVVTIFLAVLKPDADTGAVIQPGSMVFTTTAGAGSPSSQTLKVYNITGRPTSFHATVELPVDTMALFTVPADATVNPQDPVSVLVQPFTRILPAGIYTSIINFQFSDGRVGRVSVKTIVASVGANSSSLSEGTRGADVSPCVPTKLVPSLTTLSDSFQVSAGWPAAISAIVIDDCGMPLITGSVVASFSNGDPPVSLQALFDGRWEATWPTGAVRPNVSVRIHAESPQSKLAGDQEITGGLQSPQERPAFDASQVVGIFGGSSYTPIAPGGVISIYGDRLAEGVYAAPSFPLPTQLLNTQVIMAGIPLPLYYVSQSQLNAVVPYGVNVNTPLQLLIQRGLTYSLPVTVNMAAAQPEIAVADDYPANGAPHHLVTASAPARRGDTLVLYSSGLGAVNPKIDDGASAGSNLTASQVQVQIGGFPAEVKYAGLTPGFAGLYQVNVIVPDGLSPGNNVKVTISVAGQISPPATIAIQ